MKTICFLLVVLLFGTNSWADACKMNTGFPNTNKEGKVKGKKIKAGDPTSAVKYYDTANIDTLMGDNNIVLVDTRPKELFDTCTIKGAVNHPWAAQGKGDKNKLTKADVQKYVDAGKTVIYFCNSLKCYRSYNAALQSTCDWGMPAGKIGWLGKGAIGALKKNKAVVDGKKCDALFLAVRGGKKFDKK